MLAIEGPSMFAYGAKSTGKCETEERRSGNICRPIEGHLGDISREGTMPYRGRLLSVALEGH